MMDKTSNSTVSGLMSNIKDTFDINIVSKWGKGLQKGATKGLGEFADYLDKSDAKLKEAGTSLEKLGSMQVHLYSRDLKRLEIRSTILLVCQNSKMLQSVARLVLLGMN